jgi:fructose 1,6-bisphosphate aldolase/phosphatase
MRITLSVLKADIGSVGGHTLPSPAVLAAVKEVVEEAKGSLLLDAYVFHNPSCYLSHFLS